MKLLLAGASGVLGLHMTSALVAAGHEVTGLSRSPGDRLKELGAATLVGDLMDRDGLLRAVKGMRVDVLIHAATALRKTPMRHQGMAATNALRTEGMANLVEAARATGATRIVSESMHFGYGWGDWGDHVITEDNTEFAPEGRGKWPEQHLAGFRAKDRMTLRTEGLDGISLRFGALYGPGYDVGGTDALLALMKERKLPVTSSEGLLHWTYLPDAGAATVAAVEGGEPGEAYNIVDDEPVSMSEHFRCIAREFGTPTPRKLPMALLRLAGPYVHMVMSTSMKVSNAKAKRDLGWQPSFPSSREGLVAMAAAGGE